MNQKSEKIDHLFAILSMSLRYPEQKLSSQDILDIKKIINKDKRLNNDIKNEFISFFDYIDQTDLIKLQEDYVSLFDSNAELSLYIFEHVHGDSKFRGGAMSDLAAFYEEYGLENQTNELPDYIPLLIEFMSCANFKDSNNLYADFQPVFHKILNNLKKINSNYSVIFSILGSIFENQNVK